MTINQRRYIEDLLDSRGRDLLEDLDIEDLDELEEDEIQELIDELRSCRKIRF